MPFNICSRATHIRGRQSISKNNIQPARKQQVVDTSIIHDTVAVIANEVKQSSKTKMHFFKPSGLPRRLRLLMELLVERLANDSITGLPRRLRLCRASLAAEALLQ